MDLSHPIVTVTTPLLGRVLEVLAGTTRPLSASDIGRLVSDGSRQGVAKALARLEAQGVVLADRRRSAIYYSVNRDHLAWPAIEQLVRLRSTLITRLAQAISVWPVEAVHASIFGSVARGEADAASDVDLLLVRDQRLSRAKLEAWERQLDELRATILRLTGNRAQTLSVTPSELLDRVRVEDPLVTALRRDSITLAGEPIDAVIAGWSS